MRTPPNFMSVVLHSLCRLLPVPADPVASSPIASKRMNTAISLFFSGIKLRADDKDFIIITVNYIDTRYIIYTLVWVLYLQ